MEWSTTIVGGGFVKRGALMQIEAPVASVGA